MRFDELDISNEIVYALSEQGYTDLHPPQEKAIPIALTGQNLVVAVPTASGKSLIGYIPALKTIIERRKKVLYIVPLKALASEKKDDMDRFAERLGFRTAISIGDLDSEERWLNDADFIVATSEKADSLIRHGSRIIDDIGLVIADEVHLIQDPSRGPTLEVALTKIKRKHKDVQIIALSATISNAKDLAMWLDAELVKMDWRPIPLYEGVYFNWEVTFSEKPADRDKSFDVENDGEELWSLVRQTVIVGGQCIIFVNSRRSTESVAERYSKQMKKIAGRELSVEETALIEGDADSTALGRKLASCIESGMAFHNAGLTAKQRRYVEENFRNGKIKCIVATPTLAAGINLPARRVIVRDTTRYEMNSGNVPLPVMEIKQMCGRAGRPRYDPYGEAILMAKSYEDYENLMDNFVMSESETIMSKLGNEKVLRSHILGLIATGDATSAEEIIDFMRDTFYGSGSELFGIESVVENVIDYFVEHEMVERFNEEVGILPFGKKVSDLYIDPESAVILKDAVMKMEPDTSDFPILLAVAMTPDVLSMYPRKADEAYLTSLGQEWEGRLLIIPPDHSDYEYEYFMGDMKTAAVVNEWVSETNEDAITEMFGIGPGDIRSRVDNVDWLMYSMAEIAVLYRPECVTSLRNLLIRVRYGVKKELMELVSLRGIGRARARILYDRGLRGRAELISKDINDIASIPGIGMALAKKIKEQLGSSAETIVHSPSSVDDEEMLGEPIIKEKKVKEKKRTVKKDDSAPAKPKQRKIIEF